MNSSLKVLVKIRSMRPQLSAGFQRIADYICANPERVVEWKARELAAACGCDDASVVRFCQRVGYTGIHDLRSALAREFMPVQKQLGNISDAFSVMKEEFLQNSLRAITDTVSLFEEEAYRRVVQKILKARRIVTFGAGSSGMVAEDLHRKMLRMGLASYFSQDAETAKLAVALLDPGDVYIGISFSGENGMVSGLAKEARSRGAESVAVTNFPGSTLGKNSNEILQCASEEGQVRLGAMSSRFAQLMVVDFLCVMLALEDPGRIESSVIRTHRVIFK